MPLAVDVKFANLCSSRLDKFKRVGQNVFNFRCNICGDSKKDKSKARGYFYPMKSDVLLMQCKNCGHSTTLKKFLKEQFPDLYKEYLIDELEYKRGLSWESIEPEDTQEKRAIEFIKKAEAPTFFKDDGERWYEISELPQHHMAVKYVRDRKIPKSHWHRLKYVRNFKRFVNDIIPDKFESTTGEDHRIVIPFYNDRGDIFALAGRTLEDREPKYYTINENPTIPTIYGCDTVDWSKPIQVVEGPIDSLFLSNALAVGGSALTKLFTLAPSCDMSFVFDNQPRNSEVCKLIAKAIDRGVKVCIWPPSVDGLKDINDMIISGMSASEVEHIINTNSFEGARAKLKFAQWKKI